MPIRYQQDPTLKSRDDHEVTASSYHLAPEQLDALEATLVNRLSSELGATTGVVCVAVEPESELSDFCRTQESDRFSERGEEYDFFEGMKPYEDRSTFLYTVDLDLGRIAHCKRLVTALPQEEIESSGLTGMDVFDDRITANQVDQKASLDEIAVAHGIQRFSDCLNVATNQKTRRAEQTWENPYTVISYKGVYELVVAQDAQYIIAYLNKFAYDSLGGLGLEADLLCGKTFNLPIAGQSEGVYDEGYTAVVLPRNANNTKAFTEVDPDNEFTKLIAEREVPLYVVESDNLPVRQLA